jgi:hypothetical protein
VSPSSLTKNAFISRIADAFIATHPAWRRVFEHRRNYQLCVGRDVGNRCFVYIGLSCRPDRYSFGHSVGWSPSLAAYLHRLNLRENPPIYPRSGSLRKLLSMNGARDFQNTEMSIPTFVLYRPYASYDLETDSPEAVQALMLSEIEDYALPYLCLMLRERHGLHVTPAQLGSDAAIET